MNGALYTISSDMLTVAVSADGAQIKSIKDACGKEYVWCGDPEIWPETAPVLFPICGGLKDNKFIYEGKTYNLKKHGFATDATFQVEKYTKSELTLAIFSDEKTFASYPFEFEFRVRFTVSGGSLIVSYLTTNIGKKTMYYSVGAHEAYALSAGLEGSDVVFDKDESLERTVIDGALLARQTEHVDTDGNVLHMKYSHMDNDSLVFKNINSRALKLVDRKTGKGVRVDFDGFEHLLLWTMKEAPYLCVEPWNGIPDSVDSDMHIESKEGILALDPGDEQVFVHKITPIV